MKTKKIKALLEEAGVHPSRRMGQSFLMDEEALDRIAGEAVSAPCDWLLEIGSGPGNLTACLLERGARVLALERDRRLVKLLKRRMPDDARLVVIAGDALHLPFKKILPFGTMSVAGNVPYSITGEIVRHLGEDHPRIARAVILVQRELADRLLSQPSEKGYGAFTILTRALWSVERKFVVPASRFYPVPEIDSALVVLERHEDPVVKPALYPLVRRLVREAFQHRRKTLGNALQQFFSMLGAHGEEPNVLRAAGLDPKQRPETVPIENWVWIAQALRGVVR